MKRTSGEAIAIRASLVTIIGNIVLAVFKLFAGVAGKSSAMISDAAHSASDVLNTVIVIIGIRLSNRDPDKDHQYGHERMECVAALILAVILFAVGLGIGYDGVMKIMGGNFETLAIPSAIALGASIISIASKEAMYRYARAAAKKTNSGALMADAWHQRSDALSSIGSFIGIMGARLGFPIFDPIACVVICAFILKTAYGIFMESIGKMTDKACDEETVEKIKGIILQCFGVRGIDQLKTRLFGDKIYVDIEISADGNQTLTESHSIAEALHDEIENHFPQVKHCMIHVNPVNGKDSHDVDCFFE